MRPVRRIPPTGVLTRMACARVYRFIYDLLREEFAYQKDYEEKIHYWLHVEFPYQFPECYDEEKEEIIGEEGVEEK